ncbi:hypothetical protein GCM10027429_11590 [Marivirga atlantica]
MSSCSCGPDVKVGTSKLTEQSKNFLPYSGKEQLIFINQDNEKVVFTISEDFNETSNNIQTKNLCNESYVDKQYEYYDGSSIKGIFTSESGEMSIYLRTSSGPIGDDVYLFDYLHIITYINNEDKTPFKLITDTKDYQFSTDEFYLDVDVMHLGDTTLFSRPFKDVYMNIDNNSGSKSYYSTEKGLIALQDNEIEYWVLDQVIK